jgi:hypothetical protein
MEQWGFKMLLEMCKALSDEKRLELIQILAEHERIVGDLAGSLNLSEPTTSHHLSRLREVGLVTLRMEGNKRYYRINEQGLAEFKRLAADVEHLPVNPPDPEPADDSWIEVLGWGEYEEQVLHEFIRNGKLTRLPVRQLKKLMVLLRWLATRFEPEQMYTEPEVNAILKAVYETDHVSLRREMINFGYLRRERGGGKYWLAPADEVVEVS